MNKKSDLWQNWAKYLISRDKVSKLVIFASILFIALWFFALKDTVSVIVPLIGLVSAVVFSFLSYVGIGLPRIKTEKRFYDAIDSDCGFPSKYSGREMGRIKVDWHFLTARKVTVHADIASRATTSTTLWRSIRGSVSDAFTKGKENYITVFDQHHRGILTFILPTKTGDTDMEEMARSIEDLTSFVYAGLNKYGNSLPRIKDLKMGVENNEMLPGSFIVEMDYQPESYNKKAFERDFKQKYITSDALWVFKWHGERLEVSHIVRGTEDERKIHTIKSIETLISTAMNAFSYVSGKHNFTEEMAFWDENNELEAFTVDLMDTDVSREGSMESFEKRIAHGLNQLFKKPYWDCSWSISPTGKMVTVRRMDDMPAELMEEAVDPVAAIAPKPFEEIEVAEVAEEPVQEATPEPVKVQTKLPASSLPETVSRASKATVAAKTELPRRTIPTPPKKPTLNRPTKPRIPSP